MRRLRKTEGSEPHHREGRYHIGQLRLHNTPVHNELREEMAGRCKALKQAERAHEDAKDDVFELQGAADGVEIALENALRDFDADLTKLDRSDSTLNARKTIFPDGFGAVIDPDGDAQIEALAALRRRVGDLKSQPVVAENLNKLDAAEAKLTQALDAVDQAEERVEEAAAAELAARAAIRQQMEIASGKLRIHHHATPAVAEQFFLRGVSRKKKPAGGEGEPK